MALSIKQVEMMTGAKQRRDETDDQFLMRVQVVVSSGLNGPMAEVLNVEPAETDAEYKARMLRTHRVHVPLGFDAEQPEADGKDRAYAQLLHGHDNWAPRSTPVEAEDGDLFWVVNEHGKVVPAHWNAYQRGGVFQNLLSNDEGMCGFTVTHYQPIIRPEAPTT